MRFMVREEVESARVTVVEGVVGIGSRSSIGSSSVEN